MNIEVRLLVRDAVPAPLQIHVRDLIVFDDTLVYETTPTTGDPSRAQIAETRLVLSGGRVRQYAQLFGELWAVSHELTEGQAKT